MRWGAPQRGLERAGRKAVTLGELGVRAPGAAVGALNRAEEVLLEALARVLVELLVGLGQCGERHAELVRSDGEGVEELLPGIGGRVSHTCQVRPP